MLELHWTLTQDFTLQSSQDIVGRLDIVLLYTHNKGSSSTLVNHDENYTPRALINEEG